jgi:hypothetical protein
VCTFRLRIVLAPYYREMSRSRHRFTLYERAECHLCDEARVLLDAMLGMDRYERVDIDADEALILRYGFRVPVVALDGQDRLEAPITGPDLRALLAELEADGQA